MVERWFAVDVCGGVVKCGGVEWEVKWGAVVSCGVVDIDMKFVRVEENFPSVKVEGKIKGSWESDERSLKKISFCETSSFFEFLTEFFFRSFSKKLFF